MEEDMEIPKIKITKKIKCIIVCLLYSNVTQETSAANSEYNNREFPP